MVGRLILLLAAALAIQVQLFKIFKSRLFDSASNVLVIGHQATLCSIKVFKITVQLGFVSFVSHLNISRVVTPFLWVNVWMLLHKPYNSKFDLFQAFYVWICKNVMQQTHYEQKWKNKHTIKQRLKFNATCDHLKCQSVPTSSHILVFTNVAFFYLPVFLVAVSLVNYRSKYPGGRLASKEVDWSCAEKCRWVCKITLKKVNIYGKSKE